MTIAKKILQREFLKNPLNNFQYHTFSIFGMKDQFEIREQTSDLFIPRTELNFCPWTLKGVVEYDNTRRS